jgi:hypothetical protein
VQSGGEPRILGFAEWVYGWRLWAVIPLAVILFLVPMPDPVRILTGVVHLRLDLPAPGSSQRSAAAGGPSSPRRHEAAPAEPGRTLPGCRC